MSIAVDPTNSFGSHQFDWIQASHKPSNCLLLFITVGQTFISTHKKTPNIEPTFSPLFPQWFLLSSRVANQHIVSFSAIMRRLVSIYREQIRCPPIKHVCQSNPMTLFNGWFRSIVWLFPQNLSGTPPTIDAHKAEGEPDNGGYFNYFFDLFF